MTSCIGYGIGNLGFGIRDKKDKYKLLFFVSKLTEKQHANTGFTGLRTWSVRPPIPAATVTTTIWAPAHDAFGYVGVRFDMTF